MLYLDHIFSLRQYLNLHIAIYFLLQQVMQTYFHHHRHLFLNYRSASNLLHPQYLEYLLYPHNRQHHSKHSQYLLYLKRHFLLLSLALVDLLLRLYLLHRLLVILLIFLIQGWLFQPSHLQHLFLVLKQILHDISINPLSAFRKVLLLLLGIIYLLANFCLQDLVWHSPI